MEKDIDKLVLSAIQKRVFPGAVVLVGTGDKIELSKAFGTTKYADPGTKQLSVDMIYDIASLTKLFTYTAALALLEKGRFDLDTPVSEIIPRFTGEGREKIAIKHLFTHTSGLRLALSSLRDFPGKVIRNRVLKDHPFTSVGTTVYYSNVNPMLLAEIITLVTNMRFIDFLQRTILDPLEPGNTSFNPPKKFLSKIVPTENDSWRMRLVHGRVHDESAHALGGIAGHAGLFSTALDLWKFAAMWLSLGSGNGQRILKPETVKLATSPQVKSQFGWVGLGWKIDEPNFMDHTPEDSFGHTGFTGTSLVICPKKSKIIILLSNRIYPHRPPNDKAIYEVRRELCQIVLS